ncbi:MAG: dGTP triphosphohydrolase [Acidobacteriota bacterium]
MLQETGPIRTREVLEKYEEERLSCYALKSSRARRLIDVSSEGRLFDYRTEFQRDRDRIIYSRAFRRLRNKASISHITDEDHGRDRLNHTLEVSQIARTLGRGLSLNEDLIEAISLAHDLGVPPFGEAAEKTLDSILKGRILEGLTEIKTDLYGFARNKQSLRVVDLLEKRYEHEGLNLTSDTREGIVKQGEKGKDMAYPDMIKEGLHPGLAPSFEAQVVFIADEIATQIESADDGLRCGIIELKEAERLALVRELIKKIGKRYTALRGRYMKIASINRGLTHLLVTNVICHSLQALSRWAEKNGVCSTERFYQSRETISGNEISFPPRVKKMFGEFWDFISSRTAYTFHTQRVRERAKRIIEGLFMAYYRNPLILEDYLLLRYREIRGVKFLRDIPGKRMGKEIVRYKKDPRFVRLICDHIAGMTDNYARQEYEKLNLEYHKG